MYFQGRTFILWTLCLIVHRVNVQAGGGSNQGTSDPIVIQIPASNDHQSRASEENLKQESSHNISIEGDQFMLDGQPLHILSGSLHYFRLPSAYWRDRLRKLKAAGLNSVSTYVEWSFHEPEWRQYSFNRSRDVAKFVRMAAEEGLHVLLRPGPYICAERDLGGFPYWLIGKYPYIKLRSTDSDFIDESKIWMAKLFEQLSPLLFGNGGPIILVQVENEYGSFGGDKAYKEQIRDIIAKHVGTNALLYTTDGPYTNMVYDGAVSGTLTTIDFGTGTNVTKIFEPLRRYMPQGPLMNSEFYSGWLTHWGETIQQVSADAVVTTLRDMLHNKININFYMFFGGTNFEFSAGANYYDKFVPDITSYDYDAPLSEAGDPTAKYNAIREVMEQFNPGLKDIPLPTPSPKGAYGKVSVSSQIDLLSPEGRSSLGKKYNNRFGLEWQDVSLPFFEHVRQRAGLMLYETTLNATDGVLHIARPRDWIYVYVDKELKGIISRMYKKYSLPLNSKPGSVLSLLVESHGRINFGNIQYNFKGILSPVKYNNKVLNGPWTIIGYPLEDVDVDDVPAGHQTQTHLKNGPVLFKGQFTLPAGQEPLDTFIDPTGWGKGYIWVNGYNLGRYWPTLGPQVTLYVPGVWLKAAPAQNLLQILELENAPDTLTVEFIDHPILNRTGSITL